MILAAVTTWLLLVQAQQAFPPKEAWYKVIAGIIAIPTSIVGLAYSYFLIKKTRLETQKTELEIREKQSKLQELAAREPEAARQLIEPIVEGRTAQILLLRFVLLYLILRAWSFVEDALGCHPKGCSCRNFSLFKGVDESSLAVLIPFAIVQALPAVGYWFICFAVGWPLFRDINSSLRINLRELLFWWKRKRPL